VPFGRGILACQFLSSSNMQSTPAFDWLWLIVKMMIAAFLDATFSLTISSKKCGATETNVVLEGLSIVRVIQGIDEFFV
jgi:hypothetical protein